MEIDWTKIVAIITIGALSIEIAALGKPDLAASVGISVLVYLFGYNNGKRAAKKESREHA